MFIAEILFTFDDSSSDCLRELYQNRHLEQLFYPELFHFFNYFSFKINKLLILEQLVRLEQRFLCVYTCFLI
ncbi:hypothetical protein EA042_20315 [Salmonella enterica]|nr:hypothetical protein [Salmonella enterica]EAW0623653.1 hypothetical protein [Salmonella enterica subsp. enterica serovar Luciana]EAW1010234.1 hypothetical protein [Salmonella enterica subsp. enterica serovar Luciana]EAW1099236.1 hypothetical protein [Salmonella enterica subsp. enterica serovar Luciana]EBX0680892.1 hypothetical protein [Salmonella enterica subsp. enterica serovar Luciana]